MKLFYIFALCFFLQSFPSNNAFATPSYQSRSIYPPIYVSDDFYNLHAIHLLGNERVTLELDDGTHWLVHSYDESKIQTWKQNDPLMITQNHSWFSSYKFQIINKATQESIQANLHLGPFVDGLKTFYICHIDHQRKVLSLSDNTYWEIALKDEHVLQEWKVSDALIKAVNTGSDSSKPSILINVNMNDFLRAKKG